ncbi:MAG: DinB family protein [Bacteroidia bacterium]|nr:DinB family protein [Bacteroidia bacterium]
MSKIEKVHAKLLGVVKAYRTALERYSPRQLQYKPAPDQWSIGQMYSHIIMSALFFFIDNAEKCLAGHKTGEGQKTRTGTIIFLFGSFPPMRIKMPARLAVEPHQPKDLQEIREGFDNLFSRLEEVRKKFDDGFDPKKKRQNPVFGWLNALEWWQAMEIHFRHHLRQKARIDKAIRLAKIG